MAAQCFRYMAGWATKIEGSTLDAAIPYSPSNAFFGYTRKEAVGVVGAIIPWNFPLLMAVVEARARACDGLHRRAETRRGHAAFRVAARECCSTKRASPKGVVNVVTGLGRTAGAALARHPGIDKIAFTGSTPTGKAIGHAALDNMTRMSLELGGKSPVIVLPDVDIDKAAEGVANAIFFNSGQVCTAGSRVYVHDKVFDRVMERVAAIADSMPMGPGLDASTQIGPLVSARQMDRVLGYIEAGRDEGARAIAGGARKEGAGFFVKPTVLVDTDHSMRVVREEIFGPVLVAMPFNDIDTRRRRKQTTRRMVSARASGRTILSAIHKLIPRIKAGTVWVNCHSLLDNAMPFGGFKQSGFGRELGRAVIDMYTETKSVLINYA